MTLLTDTGFADLAGARASVNRLKLRFALRRAKSALAAVEDSLNQPIETMCGVRAVVSDHGGALDTGVVEGVVGGLPINMIEGNNVRQQQLLECVDLLTQGLNFLLKAPVHGASPSTVSDAVDDTCGARGAHRLSEETSLT
ncbi:MAG: hypothetical protein VYD90_13015 [Pseudomonadota bacterium]|nr:hypothetical protein [Pseudomonadota bacterium]